MNDNYHTCKNSLNYNTPLAERNKLLTTVYKVAVKTVYINTGEQKLMEILTLLILQCYQSRFKQGWDFLLVGS